MSCLLLGLSTKMVKSCMPKVCFGVVHRLLEERSELARLVAPVKEAVEEELEFLHDVFHI